MKTIALCLATTALALTTATSFAAKVFSEGTYFVTTPNSTTYILETSGDYAPDSKDTIYATSFNSSSPVKALTINSLSSSNLGYEKIRFHLKSDPSVGCIFTFKRDLNTGVISAAGQSFGSMTGRYGNSGMCTADNNTKTLSLRYVPPKTN